MEQAMEARSCTGRCGLGAPSEKLFSLSSAFVTPRVTTRPRRVAFTVRRSVCYYEKSSTHAAKEFADAVPLRFKASDQKWGLPPGTLQSRFLVRRASSKRFRRYAFLGPTTQVQSRQSMRRTLVEGRSEVANARVARHWYGLQPSRRPGH